MRIQLIENIFTLDNLNTRLLFILAVFLVAVVFVIASWKNSFFFIFFLSFFLTFLNWPDTETEKKAALMMPICQQLFISQQPNSGDLEIIRFLLFEVVTPAYLFVCASAPLHCQYCCITFTVFPFLNALLFNLQSGDL